ncbi:T-complex protein 11-domain-containing protein [Obelidium mucronatum]|nr:T-complex protein 11-domain-containing protein [Obelidium mucronatum]
MNHCLILLKGLWFFPVDLLMLLDESDYMDLVPLLPTVTRFTLRELDMDEILLNPQLRHDLYFDPNLQFKPNTDGERGTAKRLKTQKYWDKVTCEIENKQHFRIPLLIFEIKQIVKELLPYSQATHSELDANIDVGYVAQVLEHGVFDAVALMRYLAGLLKVNCAPARDEKVDLMVKACEEGRLGESLALCFEVLELMKLDYANHQLTRIRPHVVERAIEFEKNWFKDEIKWNRSTTTQMEAWFKEGYKTLMNPPSTTTTTTASTTSIPTYSKHRPPPLSKVYVHSLISTIHHSQHLNEDDTSSDPTKLPELFSMDISRLQTFRNDFQDIVILASLMMVYRQLCALKTMKENLWVLLNDSDTSLTHIVLEMCRGVGVVRGGGGKEVGEVERGVVLGVVEKTLVPDGKVFGMVLGRVGEVVGGWCERVLDGLSGGGGGGGGASGSGSVGAVNGGVVSQSGVAASVGESDGDSSSSESEAGSSPVKGRVSVLAARTSTVSISDSVASVNSKAGSKRSVELDRAKLAKYGLAELEDEVADLADRMASFCVFNHAVYFELLTGFYEEERGRK